MKNEANQKTSEPNRIIFGASAIAAGKSMVRQILAGILAALGISTAGIPKRVEGTIDTSTDLALERTFWAAERTLMGWIRTALAMISFGFTIGKIGQTLNNIEVKGFRGIHTVGIDSIAYFLVILGTVALLAAALQFSRRVYALTMAGLRPRPSIEIWVSLVLGLMGLVALSTLVLNI